MSGGTSYTTDDFDNRLLVGFGLLRTVGERSALGVSGFGSVASVTRLGVEGRYRRWIGSGGGTAEVSAGVVQHEVPPVGSSARGVTMAATLGWRDLVGVSTRVDLVRADGRTHHELIGGARLGSQAAVVGGALVAVGWAVLAALWSGFE